MLVLTTGRREIAVIEHFQQIGRRRTAVRGQCRGIGRGAQLNRRGQIKQLNRP